MTATITFSTSECEKINVPRKYLLFKDALLQTFLTTEVSCD